MKAGADAVSLERLKDFDTCPMKRDANSNYQLPEGTEHFGRMFIKVLEQNALKIRQQKAKNAIVQSEGDSKDGP